MLYMVSTPIGNLKDISSRALETLSGVEYILCEDTRRTQILLNAYGIKKKLVSFHRFNEKKSEERVLDDLRMGKNLALISDAGTPLICDPGMSLVNACRRENIACTAIPGPCSLIDALVLSGFDSIKFQFIGFLPRTAALLREALLKMLAYPGTSICFETAERIVKTLSAIEKIAPSRRLFLARELTKKFEEGILGTAKEMISHFKDKKPKGEIVLLTEEGELSTESLLPQETVELLREHFGMALKEAIKTAAKLQNINKRNLYKNIHG